MIEYYSAEEPLNDGVQSESLQWGKEPAVERF